MKKFKSHFKFSKQEQSGIFFLLLIIVVLQVVFYLWSYTSAREEGSFFLDEETQATIDSLKRISTKKDSIRLYPFNPNFISDYKGYTLGLSIEEIDRLYTYRARNKFINSVDEFQKVTKVSDSLLNVISPYFKFPDWVSNNNKKLKVGRAVNHKEGIELESKKRNIVVKDLNNISAIELQVVNGIGDKLSNRIIKFRDRLGGFMVGDQLYDVYGLEPLLVKRALERFRVLNVPDIAKININTASVEEISKLIYLKYELAIKIVEYREVKGVFKSFDELKQIEGFPVDKIDRIKLYLSL